ncbi:DUF3800 domain-containing protein [Aerolutibacter ruishenii]|uniref:Uncharacterized protein DUF3800 n=1 Tax=Aerolutibacter ruishenii TaxID=686800 RepID=A0A562LRV3_9GAMM|nr:DUF3800 domain-containing protein [Lysobacter ruishenii]TWI10322.1 uncharacterized protein DUF3800 [Lysobacter ruishenii]
MSSPTNESPQFSLFDQINPPPERAAGEDAVTPAGRFSNFIVYVDESGDHGMEKLDPNYPLFVLAFCVFYKRHYAEKVVPALEKFKFNHFGHDLVVLHETDIRKETGAFRFQSRRHKEDFLGQLTDIIEASNFILIACVIDKEQLRQRGSSAPSNPYHLALGFCLETLHDLMQEKKQDEKLTHVVVECRGKKEDAELELEFRRICDGANRKGISLPFDIIFADKRVNSSGLQLADLVARPVGLNRLRPTQENRAFDALKRKFFCSGGRDNVGAGFENWGLKVYPAPESEKPR